MRGDLSDVPVLVSGLQGADVCFHVAAKVEDFGPWRAVVEVNVEGTRNVQRVYRTAGVGRAVHVSPEAVLMHGQPLIGADERYPLAFRSRAPYSRSKALAEEVVLEESRDGLAAMIVRPRFVWGAATRHCCRCSSRVPARARSAGSAAAAT
jgi:nucleoside-diphosphate-sugar epimerase